MPSLKGADECHAAFANLTVYMPGETEGIISHETVENLIKTYYVPEALL